MARYSKIVKNKKKKSVSFIPEPMQIFIARRIIDVTGLTLLLGGIGFCLALLSYSHTDPSFNTASLDIESIENWMGQPGAYISDIFVQTLGFGGMVLALIFSVWGIRVLKRQTIRPIWKRFISSLMALLFVSISLSRLPAGDLLLHPYMGGSGGTLLLDNLAGFLQSFVGGYEHLIIAVGAIIIGTIALFHALAITREETNFVLFTFGMIIKNSTLFVIDTAAGFYHWVRHYNDANYAPPQRKLRLPSFKLPAFKMPSLEISGRDPVNAASNITKKNTAINNTKCKTIDIYYA